ncbi:MAG: hypothetical protein VX974_16535 [Pseudomonadota bacterium]|nr:hypothetical protein [Pseudomonadota bacterium]
MSGPSTPSTSALIDALRVLESSGQSPDAEDSIRDTLGLLQRMQEMRQALSESARAETQADHQGPALEPRAKALIRSLGRQVSSMAQHAEMLACALGACPDCWGGNPDCRQCTGAGRPGFFLPDEECFQHFVQPVLDRRARTGPRRMRAGFRPTPRPNPGSPA